MSTTDTKVENEEGMPTLGDRNAASAPPSTSHTARQASYHTPSQLSSPYTATTSHDPTVSDSGGGGDGGTSDTDDDKDDGQEGNSQGEAGGNNKPKMKRTPKQQLQNKQAQQRYRLRRKQKLVEMESTLELLTQKVQDMQSIQSQNYYLSNRATSLEQSIKAKEAEIAKLRQMMTQQQTQDAPGPSSSAQAPRLDPEEVKKQFVDSVEALKELISMYDLRNVDVTGAGVSESVMHQCRTLVQHACRQCHEAMTEEQAVVLKVVARDPGSMTPMDAQTDRSRWLTVVQAIRMTSDQVDCVLRVRREQLRKLRQIYEERVQLSAAAAEAFLPSNLPTQGGGHQLDKGISALMQNLNMHGYLYTVQGKITMAKVLASLKENLDWEQRTIVDFNYMITNHVLSPIQTALLFVEAFPFHCDVLALANVLALARGDSSPGESDSEDDFAMRDASQGGGTARGGLPGGRNVMSPIPDAPLRQPSPVNGMGGQMPMLPPHMLAGAAGGGPKHMQLTSRMDGPGGGEGPVMMPYPLDRPTPGGMMRR